MQTEELDKLFDLSKSVNKITADLQTKTCAALITMLQKVPGAILGDDVGMGKTYVAFSTAVYYLSKYPNKKIIIITPGWMLNKKWFTDIRNFIAQNLNKKALKLVEKDIQRIRENGEDTKDSAGTYLEKIQDAVKMGKVILLPVNVFSYKPSRTEQAYYVNCWFKHRRLRKETRKKILRLLGFKMEEVNNSVNVYDEEFPSAEIHKQWYKEADEIYDNEDFFQKNIGLSVKFMEALSQLKQRFINRALPRASLLILDEAHKMKNEGTLRRKSLEIVIDKKFDKGIFLTATPFQLGEKELISVQSLFDHSLSTQEEKYDYKLLRDKLQDAMDRYKKDMGRFEKDFRELTPTEISALSDAIIRKSFIGLSVDCEDIYNQYKNLLRTKENLETVMSKLIVRNVKKKDVYRNEIVGAMETSEKHGLPLSEEAYIPYALIEKAIYQLLRKKDRTFITSVEQSFTSSFDAVLNSKIMKRETPAVKLLAQMGVTRIKHPKMENVCKKPVDLVMNHQKVLIFCDREKTMHAMEKVLSKELDGKIQRNIHKLFPDKGKDGFDNYCKRFYSKQDISWFLLQENYIYSVLLPALQLMGLKNQLLPKAQDIRQEVNKIYPKVNSSKKTNYLYVKRIVEHIVFRDVLSPINNWQEKLAEKQEMSNLINTILVILDEKYITGGLILTNNNAEKDVEEDHLSIRPVGEEIINNVLEYKGIWVIYAQLLNKLPPDKRENLIQLMIQFLRNDQRFFIQLRTNQEKNIEKYLTYSELINKTFATKSLLDWQHAYRRFLERYCVETEANQEEMELGLKATKRVGIINGKTKIESRGKIRAGFNTPFYPQILIASVIMQEGLDLQKECKEIIHYDMEWNPASMEQRVGRVDRIGSLISELLYKGEEESPNQAKTEKLDIYYPYLKNTIDENIYDRVKKREKWFNLILGGTPQWDTFELDSDVANIPENIFKTLQVDLSVK